MSAIPTSVSSAERARLQELARGKSVLEIGAWLGGTTVALCAVAKRVDAVDWFRGDDHAGERDFQELLSAYAASTAGCENLVTHIGRFEQVLPSLQPEFEFCFVDGYHSSEATAFAGRWARRLTAGPIAFHDYGLYGVADAVGKPYELVESLAIFT